MFEFGSAQATPLLVLSAERQRQMSLPPLIVITDWSAGKFYWTHGAGIGAGRVPIESFAELQAAADAIAPTRKVHKTKRPGIGRVSVVRWEFRRRDGTLFVIEDNGRGEFLTTY